MITGIQVRMARAGLRLRTRDLARQAAVSPNTITRIEAELGANPSTLAAVQRALEAEGAVFGASAGLASVTVPTGSGMAARTSTGSHWMRPDELNASNDI
jgi:DNA-binding XRE family transcriptional regulator